MKNCPVWFPITRSLHEILGWSNRGGWDGWSM
jgi:hypothetical protein